MKTHIRLFFALILLTFTGFSQPGLHQPWESQQAEATQRIGLTDIKIVYHSPLVKERNIWGTVVPYNQVWRAGANENTTISFSDDVMIEGKVLPAGTYGLHMIPGETEWVIIFSKNYTSWGSFFYKPEEDALRVKVKPGAVPFQEWLSYNFIHPKPNSVSVALHWEKLEVRFNVEVDVHKVVLASFRNELRSIPGFSWKGWSDAADYCNRNNTNIEEAIQWVDRSLKMQENFTNLITKSELLEKKGNAKDAGEFRKKAFDRADETQINLYGYNLLNAKKLKEAITVFEFNVKKYPASWNVYDSLGEALDMAGDKKNALKNYQLALAKAPADAKGRIQKIIENLSK